LGACTISGPSSSPGTFKLAIVMRIRRCCFTLLLLALPAVVRAQTAPDSVRWRAMLLEKAIDRIRPLRGGPEVEIGPAHGIQPSQWLVAFIADVRAGVDGRPVTVDSSKGSAGGRPSTEIEFGEPAAPRLPSYPPGFRRLWRLPVTTSQCASSGAYFGSFVDLTVVEVGGELRVREDGYGTFDGACAERRLDGPSRP
jgi:hypothetical protein